MIKFHQLKHNKSPFRLFFTDIVSTELLDSSKLKITLKENFLIDFKQVIESSFFIPVNQGVPINNGPYSFKGTNLKFKKNKKYWNKKVKRYPINFLLNQDSEKSQALYESQIITMTSNTHFNEKMLTKFKYTKDFNLVKSKLLFLLEIKDKGVKELIREKREYFLKNKKILKLLHPLTENWNIKFDKWKKPLKPVKIVYANYYPNSEVIDLVSKILDFYEIETEITVIKDLAMFSKLDKEKYDVILHLITPPINDINSYKLLFKKNRNEHPYLSFDKYYNFLPLFEGKSFFLKDKNLNIELDELGQILFDKIEWREDEL